MRRMLSRWLLAATVAGSALVLAQPTGPHATPASSYIVQSHGTQSAARIVRGVGGHITHDLPLIHRVSARPPPAQAARLRRPCAVARAAGSPVMPPAPPPSYHRRPPS